MSYDIVNRAELEEVIPGESRVTPSLDPQPWIARILTMTQAKRYESHPKHDVLPILGKVVDPSVP